MADARGRFLARRGASVGLALLAALFALAAWAPFLANDRPYVLVAADHGALERARGELVPLAESVFASGRALSASPSDPAMRARAESERAAFERRVALLESAEGARDVPAIAQLRRAFVKLPWARAGVPQDSDGASRRTAFIEAAHAVRVDLEGVTLRAPSVRTYPLLASLGALDVAFALAPIAALVAWGLARRVGLRRAAIAAAAPVALLALAAGLARDRGAQIGPKASAARGGVAVESALWPPIPYGYAETNLGEAWRPPTWLASSRMDADGHFLGGRRADAPPAGRPEVRPGEPALDSAWRHLLGTDALGRDVAARVLWGGRISLAIGVAAAVLLTLIGVLLGAAAGFLGGIADAVVSRAIEVVLCFPAFFLVLCAIAWTDPDVVPVPFAVVLVIAAVGWTGTARLVRAEALRVVAAEHVLAARALGLHPVTVLVRHVVPNSIGPALVAFGFAAGGAIGVESALAFLGLGAQVPFPSWGGLVGESRSADQAWAWIAPGCLVFLAVLAWVLVAEAAREALDPRAEMAGDP